MKLDATAVRYLDDHTFRVLSAVEQGSKNHEIVPTPLIAQLSRSRSGGVNKALSELMKRRLVSRERNAKYEGFRLAYGGYDYLACRTLSKRDTIYSIGNQIGTGKESDIYVVADNDGNSAVLKIHRLGRMSFRSIKTKRDYLRDNQSASWMYMSRLAAIREFSFMKALYENGFPVPKPIDQNRHCIVMEFIDSFPMRQVESIPEPWRLYDMLLSLLVRLAHAGLVHGDFNEFNVLLKDARSPEEIDHDLEVEESHRIQDKFGLSEEEVSQETSEDIPKADGAQDAVYPLYPILIDFPQMISLEHPDAEECFNRDVDCLRGFFSRRFRYEAPEGPTFAQVKEEVLKTQSCGSDLHVKFEEALQLQDLPKRERVFESSRAEQSRLDEINKVEDSDDVSEASDNVTGGSDNDTSGHDDDSASGSDIDSSENTEEGESSGGKDEEAGNEKREKRLRSKDKNPESQPRTQYQYTRRGLAPTKASRKSANKLDDSQVENIVAQSLAQKKQSDARKHHGAKTVTSRALGRQKGSKKKQDKRNLLSTIF